jgi:hypothetical protein
MLAGRPKRTENHLEAMPARSATCEWIVSWPVGLGRQQRRWLRHLPRLDPSNHFFLPQLSSGNRAIAYSSNVPDGERRMLRCRVGRHWPMLAVEYAQAPAMKHAIYDALW